MNVACSVSCPCIRDTFSSQSSHFFVVFHVIIRHSLRPVLHMILRMAYSVLNLVLLIVKIIKIIDFAQPVSNVYFYNSDHAYEEALTACSDIGNRLETTVYPVIRHKLSKALVSWHPSDRSAKLMLVPWHGVFSRGDMDAFLVKNIVPKLQLALQELVINPHQQHLGENEGFGNKMT